MVKEKLFRTWNKLIKFNLMIHYPLNPLELPLIGRVITFLKGYKRNLELPLRAGAKG